MERRIEPGRTPGCLPLAYRGAAPRQPTPTATAIHTAIRGLGPAELEVLLRFVERCARESWIGLAQAAEWRQRVRLRLSLLELLARRSTVLRSLR